MRVLARASMAGGKTVSFAGQACVMRASLQLCSWDLDSENGKVWREYSHRHPRVGDKWLSASLQRGAQTTDIGYGFPIHKGEDMG